MNPIRTIQLTCLTAFLIIPFCVKAQNVAIIDNNPILSKEFIWVYKKNNGDKTAQDYEHLSAYLELYIDYKLKVLEAKALKLDLDPAFILEVNNFEKIIKSKFRSQKKELEYVLNEYKDGVLMFNVTEKLIWEPSYAAQDSDIEKIELLEKKWIQELRNKYKVVVLQDELRKIARQ